ncbi:MAG: type I restriction endonuclease [Lachnospiraceae bacterium]|nr:type I restriction endonuclease [Lachnospiraceae bacterium]
MDFDEKIKSFSDRIPTILGNISTEEATKTSIIMPFFSLLGYDVFNPQEFLPEYVADVGIKKGEKVDYAILQNGEPVILIEAKCFNKKLEKHDSQLFRYFATTKSKFAILTNGIIYRFYTDLEEVNKMDKEPFLEIDLLNLRENKIIELKKFTKENFDSNKIFTSAESLKYVENFKSYISQQLQNPTDDFTKICVQNVYAGAKTQTIIEKFRPILKKALNDFLNDTINDKIKAALNENRNETTPIITNDEPVKTLSDAEQEAFFAVKNILKNTVNMTEISYKITDSYLAVVYNNNSRKWICRFIFNSAQSSVILPDENKNEIKLSLESINDIYRFENDIIAVVNRYMHPDKRETTTYVVDLVYHGIRRKRTLPNKYLKFAK